MLNGLELRQSEAVRPRNVGSFHSITLYCFAMHLIIAKAN